jgi:hypothetical protein
MIDSARTMGETIFDRNLLPVWKDRLLADLRSELLEAVWVDVDFESAE